MLRYRFSDFTLSTARRQLFRGADEVALIPRYFDLLVMLIERRHQAVHRREIFDRVWSDVVVSDGALSQAVRTLRRALGDDPREPRFVRTVSRHGYQFVWPDVGEEGDAGPLARVELGSVPGSPEALLPSDAADPGGAARADPFEAPLQALADAGASRDEDDRREAAETLHALGTAEALRRLQGRRGHERARALLRDSRFDVPGAGQVPIFGQPGALATFSELGRLRLRRAQRLVGARLSAATTAGLLVGLGAGFVGGHVLRLSPGAELPPRVPVALALVGAAMGAVGAAGVGAGLTVAEALVRSWRGRALVLFGAAACGAVASRLAGLLVEGVFGVDVPDIGGGLEGALIGAAAGLGYALATPRPGEGGIASPRGIRRLRAALLTGLACMAAAVALTAAGGRLGGASIESVARAFPGSKVSLTPLARLLGEPAYGPRTAAVTSAYEGLLFGCGLALGLTHRPRSQTA